MLKKRKGGFLKTLALGSLSLFFLLFCAGLIFAQSSKDASGKQLYPGINAPWSEPQKFTYKGTITIGDASDLTGPAGKTVSQMSGGVADWIRYQNEYLGGVEGYKIAIDIVDTKLDPQNVVNTYNRFIDEGKLIIYSGGGYVTPVSTEICNRRKIPTLGSSGSVTQAIMTPAEEAKRDNYFFQMSPVVASRQAILVKFCLDIWKKSGKTSVPKFGTFNVDSQSGHEAATAARMYIKKHGAEFTVHTFHGPMITDAKAQVTALKNAKVDFIIQGPDYDQPLTVFALELDRQKSGTWKPIFAGHTDFGTAYIDTGNRVFEGHYSYQYCLDWSDVNEPIIRFLHELNKKWHPEVKKRPFLYQAGAQAGMVIAEAFKRALKQYGDPSKLDGVKMRQTLETFKDFDPLGMSGPITYTHYDHQGVTSLRIAECKDKKMVAVTGFIQADPLAPEERDGKYWLKD